MRRWLHLAALALLGVAVAACGAESTPAVVVTDSAGVRVAVSGFSDRTYAVIDTTPVLSLGGADAAGPTLFSNVRGMHVDAAGNLWIADAASGELRVFRADGSHWATRGGLGEGPGEFRRLRPLGAFRGDSAAYWDDALLRLTVFEPGGDLVRVFDVPSGEELGPQPLAVFEDGSLLAQERRTLQAASIEPGTTLPDTMRLFRLDPRDASQRPIARMAGPIWVWTGRSQIPVPFTVNPGVAVAGEAVHAVAGPTFRVRVWQDGHLVEAYGIDRAPRPVTSAVVKEYVEFFERAMPDSSRRAEYLSAMDHASRPELMPGYDDVIVAGDGPTWARVYAPDLLAAATWDVFAPDRAWLGSVVTPAGLTVHAVAGDRVYGVWRDELGVEHIRAYRLAPADQASGAER